MLPPEFRNADPAQFFPEFRKGKVLRFQRLFGPVKRDSEPQIWPRPKQPAAEKKTGADGAGEGKAGDGKAGEGTSKAPAVKDEPDEGDEQQQVSSFASLV